VIKSFESVRTPEGVSLKKHVLAEKVERIKGHVCAYCGKAAEGAFQGPLPIMNNAIYTFFNASREAAASEDFFCNSCMQVEIKVLDELASDMKQARNEEREQNQTMAQSFILKVKDITQMRVSNG